MLRARLLVISVLAAFGMAGVVLSAGARAAVIEFYNPDLDNYFITAEPDEQVFIDTGAVGRWQRTGSFAAGGPNQVCRFYGNGAINPATGTFYGPNSHFYTADPAECAGLKALYSPTARSWKFESDDFPTTLAANGACPAKLAPVYRAYNNGFARGVDSNHRITSDLAAYLQTVAAGWTGEGIVMCAPSPAATAMGVAAGAVTSATIGAAGGSVSAPDGRVAVTIPAGALSANTVIGIQPFTNLAHGKIGAAYQLTPEGQTFLQPVTLKFSYTDADLIGTSASALGAAFQTPDGYWRWAGAATVDTTAKSVSVTSTHFSLWSLTKDLQMIPASKTVRVSRLVDLQVVICYDRHDPRGFECDPAIANTVSYAFGGGISAWSVNGLVGGGNVFGAVSGARIGTAHYFSPQTEPTPPTVAVAAHMMYLGMPTQIVSNLTIAGDSWTGTGSSTSPGGVTSATAEVKWTLESTVNKVATYRPNGTASLTWACAITPSSAAIDPASDGSLVIDYNASPPTYSGVGSTSWAIMVNCAPGLPSFPSIASALFLGGSAPLGRAEGSVSADGQTIQGTSTNIGGTVFNWKFTRELPD